MRENMLPELRQLGDAFVGLWCFRVYGQTRKYAVTLNIGGCYYDTVPAPTMGAAITTAIATLKRAKRKTHRKEKT